MARTDTAGHDAAPQAQSGSLVGQILDGRYRILRKLGEGAMGEVYAAEHVAIGKKFAIKLLHPETVSNPEALTRLFQRARSASLITHRNIVEIIDFGQLSPPTSGMKCCSKRCVEQRVACWRRIRLATSRV